MPCLSKICVEICWDCHQDCDQLFPTLATSGKPIQVAGKQVKSICEAQVWWTISSTKRKGGVTQDLRISSGPSQGYAIVDEAGASEPWRWPESIEFACDFSIGFWRCVIDSLFQSDHSSPHDFMIYVYLILPYYIYICLYKYLPCILVA